MDHRQLFRAALLSLVLAATAATPTLAAKPPTTWDGLLQVKSKRFDLVYLAPGATFTGYTKVMLDPTEISFEKNWRRDYNQQGMGVSRDISEKDVKKAITEGVAAAGNIFVEEFTKGGYPVVTEPGPDVLWLRTGVLDVRVSAPDTFEAGRTYTFANDAGEATYFVEVRDSLTGALLGRAVDRRLAGDNTVGQRNRVTNRMDFRRLVERWAELSIRGLNELKTRAPIDDTGRFAGTAP
ncbi:hypothetical protein ASD21_00275 [Caulobacter sp. Root1455]|nr:hypothetical protein ASD38_05030 [Caulobacter sp. Root487D2Y]KQZ06116.1 hypothetical protein ASD21_00275 [Caulobacter sp. Root1455]